MIAGGAVINDFDSRGSGGAHCRRDNDGGGGRKADREVGDGVVGEYAHPTPYVVIA